METLPGKITELKVGDLLYTKEGTSIYIFDVENSDEFNEEGKMVKYVSVKFLNGKQEGRTTWGEEKDLLDLINANVYTYLPVKE